MMTFKQIEISQITNDNKVIDDWSQKFSQIQCNTEFEKDYWVYIMKKPSNKVSDAHIKQHLLIRDMIGNTGIKSVWYQNGCFENTDYIQQLYMVRRFAMLDYSYREMKKVYKYFGELVSALHKSGILLPKMNPENIDNYPMDFHLFLLDLYVSCDTKNRGTAKLKKSIESISIAICDCM